MRLCFYWEASVFWRLAALDVCQQTLEVSVYHSQSFHLLVKVFKIQLVLSMLGQFFSFWPFQLPFAFCFFLPFKQILPCLFVQAAFAEMFVVKSLALVIQESCQPVERVVALLSYHDIDPWDSPVFFTDPVHDDVFLFPFKLIACKIRIFVSPVCQSVKPRFCLFFFSRHLFVLEIEQHKLAILGTICVCLVC